MEPSIQINTTGSETPIISPSLSPETQSKKYKLLSIVNFLLTAILTLLLYTYLDQLIFLTKESSRFNTISGLYVEYILIFLVFLGTIINLLAGIKLFYKWIGIRKYLGSIVIGITAILLAIPAIAINSVLTKADYPQIKKLNDLSPEEKVIHTSNINKEADDVIKQVRSTDYLIALERYKYDFKQYPWQEKPLNRPINTLAEVNNLLVVNQKYLESSFLSSNNLSELFLTQNSEEKISVCFMPKSTKFMSEARSLGLGINGLPDSSCAALNLCYLCVTMTGRMR